MMKPYKMSDARKFSFMLLATLLFIGLLSLESHASVTVGYIFFDGKVMSLSAIN
jgi:hypothetical protein